jgi:hypothetical protein
MSPCQKIVQRDIALLESSRPLTELQWRSLRVRRCFVAYVPHNTVLIPKDYLRICARKRRRAAPGCDDECGDGESFVDEEAAKRVRSCVWLGGGSVPLASSFQSLHTSLLGVGRGVCDGEDVRGFVVRRCVFI